MVLQIRTRLGGQMIGVLRRAVFIEMASFHSGFQVQPL
jgi:hypothetical protein